MSESPDGIEAEAASLDRLAELVADGGAVDWDAVSQGEPDEARLHEDLLIALRAVEAVGLASRRNWEDGAPAVRGAAISSWGELEIVEALGRGSFGEVYLARDPLLNRLVALKLYRPAGNDRALTETTLREGRLLARLRHPGIATVYGVDYHDGRFGMWMEFVDGETLASAVSRRGPLSPREVAGTGIELCQALAEVHHLGILHRDVKAQNVIREHGGRLVLVDFGLGLEERRAEMTGPSGTPLYLAPELLAGGPPSVATDLYALGVLLFFLVSGDFPFAGGTLFEVCAAHAAARRAFLRDLRPDISPQLAQVVERALDPDPAKRFRSAGEMEAALVASAASRVRRRRLVGTAAVAVLVVVAAAGGVLGVRAARDSASGEVLFQGGTSRRLTATAEWETEPALSPDGSFVAYVAYREGNFDLWLTDSTGGAPVRLSSGPEEERRPRWFPDGSRLVFEAVRRGVPSVWTIGRLGGPAEFVLDRAGDPAVSPDGRSLAVSLADTRGTRRVAVLELDHPDAGPRLVTGDADGFWDHRRPAWSPDGRKICYQDLGNLWLVEVESGATSQLTRDGAGYVAPSWAPDGHAVYAQSRREGTMAIWRVALDGTRVERVTLGTGPESEPSLSADGRRLAYATLREELDIVLASFGTGETHVVRSDALDITPALAPGGSFLVFSSDRRPPLSLWRQEIVSAQPRGELALLLAGTRPATNPAVSNDEKWVAYQLRDDDRRGVFVSPTEGGREVRISPPDEDAIHPSWSPIGDEVLYVAIRDGQHAIAAARFVNGKVAPARTIIRPSVPTMHPRLSPDRRWVAFIGVEGEAAEVFLGEVDNPLASIVKLTSGAIAEDLAWLDSEQLVVSGAWGGSRLRMRTVTRDGRVADLSPGFDLGFGGTFSIAGSRGLVAFSRAEPRGDLWLIDAH